jgi:tetratricopeptide (TPR) repeat protein
LSRSTAYDGWQSWQPVKPTLVVVDYLAGRAKTVSDAILTLTDRATALAHPVRFLLLERLVDRDALWVRQLQRIDSNSEHDRIRSSEHAPYHEVGRLSFESIWQIICEVFSARGVEVPEEMRDPIVLALDATDPMRRPLFAALAGEALADERGFRQWNANDLAAHIVRRERSRWEQELVPRERCQKYLNLLLIATVCSGLPVTVDVFEKQLAEVASEGLLPAISDLDEIAYHEMTGAIVDEADELPPWEPDILGECFVLDRVARAGPAEKLIVAKLLRAAWNVNPEYAAVFLARAASDFPAHTGLKRLLDTSGVPRKAIGVWVTALADVATSLGFLRQGEAVDHVVGLMRATLKNKQFKARANESLCRALYNLGVTAMQRDSVDTAIKLFNEVIDDLHADGLIRGSALTNRGILRNAIGDSDGGIADATDAIRTPNISDEIKASSLNNRGDFQRAKGLLDEASDDHSSVLQLAGASDERRFVAHFRRGVIRLAKGEFTEALSDFAAIDTLDVSQRQRAEALVAQGYSLEQLKRNEEAMIKYDSALVLPRISNGDACRAHMGRARILAKAEKNDAALDEVAHVINNGLPEYRVDALVFRSDVLAKAGKLATALAELRDAIAESPDAEDANVLRIHRGQLTVGQEEGREYEGDLRSLVADHSANSLHRARAAEVLAILLAVIETRSTFTSQWEIRKGQRPCGSTRVRLTTNKVKRRKRARRYGVERTLALTRALGGSSSSAASGRQRSSRPAARSPPAA